MQLSSEDSLVFSKQSLLSIYVDVGDGHFSRGKSRGDNFQEGGRVGGGHRSRGQQFIVSSIVLDQRQVLTWHSYSCVT